MNLKAALIAGVASAAVGLSVAGCQTYDFEPVEPLALSQVTESAAVQSRKKKPNIMLLVDKSGSMNEQITSSTTRLSEMKLAMDGFLGQYGTTARFGLAVFPEATGSSSPDLACRAGRVAQDVTVSDDVDAELNAAASQINDTIQQLGRPGGPNVTGGTPTAASLNRLADNPILLDDTRDNFILLLTDGLPNCNGSLDGATCTCLEGDGTKACQIRENCLDQDATVQAIANLASRKIRTIVVGFGLDTGAGPARATLNAMAQAGGFPRSCSAGQNCDAFYQAANAKDLAAALIEIQKLLIDQKPCEFPLSAAPTDERFLTVYVDGQRVSRGPNTWSYSSTGVPTVIFTGDVCTRLETTTTPVEVEIRLVEGL